MVQPEMVTQIGALLAPWQNALVVWVRGDRPDLTTRQMALLMLVAFEPGKHTVRSLAGELGVGKPIISRVLDRLSLLGYAARVVDRRDRRNVFVVATEAGCDFLEDFAEGFASHRRRAAGKPATRTALPVNG